MSNIIKNTFERIEETISDLPREKQAMIVGGLRAATKVPNPYEILIYKDYYGPIYRINIRNMNADKFFNHPRFPGVPKLPPGVKEDPDAPLKNHKNDH